MTLKSGNIQSEVLTLPAISTSKSPAFTSQESDVMTLIDVKPHFSTDTEHCLLTEISSVECEPPSKRPRLSNPPAQAASQDQLRLSPTSLPLSLSHSTVEGHAHHASADPLVSPRTQGYLLLSPRGPVVRTGTDSPQIHELLYQSSEGNYNRAEQCPKKRFPHIYHYPDESEECDCAFQPPDLVIDHPSQSEEQRYRQEYPASGQQLSLTDHRKVELKEQGYNSKLGDPEAQLLQDTPQAACTTARAKSEQAPFEPSDPSALPLQYTGPTHSLTLANLLKIRGTPSSPSAISDQSNQSEVDTRFESHSQSAESTMPESTPQHVRSLLRRNRMYIDDERAKAIGSTLIEKAKGVINAKRGSDWSSAKDEEKTKKIIRKKNESERTFLINLLMNLLDESRLVLGREMNENEKYERQEWISRQWEDDHLWCRWDQNLSPEYVPKVDLTGEPFWDQLLDSVPRVKNPRPDLVWSIYQDAFDQRTQDLFIKLKTDVAGVENYHSFLVLEGKCMNASIHEAENQCVRSGAVMVNNRRHLAIMNKSELCLQPLHQSSQQQVSSLLSRPGQQHHHHDTTQAYQSPPQIQASLYQTSSSSLANSLPASKGASPTPPQPIIDMDSLAFSVAVAADQAKIFVHWVLLEALPIDNAVDTTISFTWVRCWHMHRLRTYSLEEPDHISQLHHDLDNVLDWGIGSQRRKIERMVRECREDGITPQLPVAVSPATASTTKRRRGIGNG